LDPAKCQTKIKDYQQLRGVKIDNLAAAAALRNLKVLAGRENHMKII